MKLINKDALVAEIEKIKKEECLTDTYEGRIKLFYFERFLSFLNSLEVKEVELEKEIKNVQRKYKTIDEYEDYPCTMYANDIEWIAKHFFEFGLIA